MKSGEGGFWTWESMGIGEGRWRKRRERREKK